MPRPRGFELDAVVASAEDVFWERGYACGGLAEIEEATGLTRSSLYQAFGNKQALFDRALDRYIETFLHPLIGPMEADGASLDAVAGFFSSIAKRFRGDAAAARRGCLWINAIAESEGREPRVDARATVYLARLRNAFMHALSSTRPAEDRADHARVLMASTVGVWLVARVDPEEAALMCDSVVTQLRGWTG